MLTSFFNPSHDITLESVTFLDEFFHALGIGALTSRQTLRVS
jgi:hypothetical protein